VIKKALDEAWGLVATDLFDTSLNDQNKKEKKPKHTDPDIITQASPHIN
jgi:hypothetical protein